MAYGLSNSQVTDDVTSPPKVLWGNTVGYPSDSLASCFNKSTRSVWRIRWGLDQEYSFDVIWKPSVFTASVCSSCSCSPWGKARLFISQSFLCIDLTLTSRQNSTHSHYKSFIQPTENLKKNVSNKRPFQHCDCWQAEIMINVRNAIT